MAARKYNKNIIYQATDEDVAMLEALCENRSWARSQVLRELVRESYRAMRKAERDEAQA